MYKLTNDINTVIRTTDNTYININNVSDWTLYQQWLDENNTPDSADEIPFIAREIDSRRLRLALHELNLLTDIEAAITTLDKAAQIDWEYATHIKEDYPLVQALASQLNIDINLIFETALNLT